MLILGIETSCDDTCAAIVKATGRKNPRFKILSNIRSSQITIHNKFGGVVPHLAARAHVENMNHVLKRCFEEAKIQMLHAKRTIDLIAVTTHPGLIPCLLIGTNVARTLAWLWQKPIIGVNHLDGHIYANWVNPIGENPKSKYRNPKQTQKIEFPAICLVVSGGHTQLIFMRGHDDFKIIGETRDDAAGEAFDKVAKLLGLPFPGGPPISQLAAKSKTKRNLRVPSLSSSPSLRVEDRSRETQKEKITLPRPMINSKDYDFSFSGLKTAVLYLVQDLEKKYSRCSKKSPYPIPYTLYPQLCAEFQQAVIDVLIAKTVKAAKTYRVNTVIIGGGVATNKELKKQLKRAVRERLPGSDFRAPPISLAVDNAAMIAAAGWFDYLNGKTKTWKNIKARAVV